MAQTGAAPDQKSAARDKKIDYAPLRRLILNGQLKAGTVIVNKAQLNRVRLKIKAKNGVIHLDPFSLDVYEGKIAGSGVFNVKRKVPASALQMRVSNLQAGPLLRDQMDKDTLEGTANADISLQMTGDDPDRIKKTLNGKGQLRFNDGAIVGIDLAAMARNVKAAFGRAQPAGQKPRTDFAELLAPFTIRNGVVTTTRTSMKSPFLRVLAAGKADLVKERLDFRIEPKFVETSKGQGDKKQRSGITVPVLVSGTFSKPAFEPDLKAMAEQQIEKEVFEHKEVKKLFEKEELKPYEDTAKELLKGFFKD
jgi:AsmA protein